MVDGLNFAFTESECLLTDGHQKPCLANFSSEQYHSLVALSRITNFSLCECKIPSKEFLPTQLSSIVVGLGKENFGHARLYAHLTSRKLLCIDDIGEIEGIDLISVVVTQYKELNNNVIKAHRELALNPNSEPIGFILAKNSADLWKQVLLRSATAICSQNENHKTSAPKDVGMLESLISNLTEVPLVVKTSDLQLIHTHSDGIDAKLPNGDVLCSIKPSIFTDKTSLGKGNFYPPCVDRNFCHRLNVPLSQSFDSNKRIDTSSISTPVLLLDACAIFRPWRNLLDEKYTLLDSIMENGVTGAIITNSEVAIASIEQLAILVGFLATETDIGAAVKKFHQSEKARLTDRVLFIVGDPKTRCKIDRHALEKKLNIRGTDSSELIPSVDEVLPLEHQSQAKFAPRDMTQAMQFQFIKGCMNKAWATKNNPKGLNNLELNEFNNEILKSDMKNNRSWWSQKTRKFLREENFTGIWIHQFGLRYIGDAICQNCLSIQSEFRSLLNVIGLERRIVVCQDCGISEDSYVKNRVGIRIISSKEVLLIADDNFDGWEGELSTWVGNKMITAVDWPKNCNGTLSTRFHIKEGLPIGLIKVHIWIWRNFEVIGASVRCRV